MILTIDEATRLVQRCMIAAGHDRDEAAIIADHLIDCELRGLSFGGLPRALSVLERLRETGRSATPIRVVKESPVSAALDGADQIGYLVARRATDIALEKARQTGIAVVSADNTWYTGMFSYYLEMVTRAGFAGMIAGSGGQRVAPHGGTEPRWSTNPIAFGFPAEGTPVIWDIGTSAIMLGEAMLASRLGKPLPEGVAFDVDGHPTRDADAALAGAFAIWGGHKGSGLALSVSLLGMMSGAMGNAKGVRDCGYFMLVIDPALLTDADDYRRRVADFADRIRSTRPLDPERPVRVPFERSASERERRREANAIEVADVVFDALAKVAERGIL